MKNTFIMLIKLAERVSHQLWRRIVKRERRRRVRQRNAQERELRYQEERTALLRDPSYLAELQRLEVLEEEAQRMEEQEAARKKEEWLLRDAALHSMFLKNKQKRLMQQQEREKQEALIKKEWEEEQRKKKEEEQKKEEQVWLWKPGKISFIFLQVGEETQNPEPPQGITKEMFTRQRGEPCPFFAKTGACRFGIQCSREHDYPERSQTVLLPNMYSHFGMEYVALEGDDVDISLEYSESEIYLHFRDFFEDILPEFQRCGNVIQLKVCCNTIPHLRGNVYVQYSREEDAASARTMFNGRWYAGRQLTCVFVTIEKWKSALCGLFWRQQCPKGGQCNFLHAYRNPGNAFWRADHDFQPLEYPRNPQTTKHPYREHLERSTKPRRSRESSRSRRRSRSRSKTESSGSDREYSRTKSKSRSRSRRLKSRSERSASRSKKSLRRSDKSTGRSER
ncbi:uncharacterized protein [Panulirus ornatus]|uniref:uncharacterized protein n=1 Tax=Panulirus ornatus TaxID=150431 RepID=UPI003A8AC2C4